MLHIPYRTLCMNNDRDHLTLGPEGINKRNFTDSVVIDVHNMVTATLTNLGKHMVLVQLIHLILTKPLSDILQYSQAF